MAQGDKAKWRSGEVAKWHVHHSYTEIPRRYAPRDDAGIAPF